MVNKLRKLSILFLVLTLFCFVLPFVSASNWLTGSNWQVGSNWQAGVSFTITVVSTYGNPTSSGSVAQNGSYATSVTSPSSGGANIQYVCSGYSIDGGGSVAGTNYTFTNVQANHTITYSWTTQYYLSVVSSYGNQQGIGWYNSGTTASFNVTTPFSGGIGTRYSFTSWVGSGVGSYSGTTSNYSVTMNNAITETATWQTQYLLTPSNDTNSAITPSTATWVNSGASQSFNYSATAPFNITAVYVDSSNVTNTGTYAFTNISASHTIQVFSADTTPPVFGSILTNSTLAGANITVSCLVNDEVALEPNGTYQFGTNNTGSWVWESLVNFTSTPETVVNTLSLNDTVGVWVACQYNFTDNTGEASSTSIQFLTTTDVQPTPTATPAATHSRAYYATQSAFNNSYIALGLVSVSLIVVACLSILKSGEGEEGGKGMLVGVMALISGIILLVVGVMVISGFENSELATITVILLGLV